MAQHRAGIEAHIHLHDGDSGLFIPMQDGGIDRRCSPPARQERRVDVDAPIPWKIQHLLTQDLAERSHHDQVRVPEAELLHGFRLAQFFRLDQGDTQFEGKRFDRRRLELAAPS